MADRQTDQIIGVVLIVLGILILLGFLGVGWLVTIGAVAAIIVGILILMKTIKGSQAMGVALLVAGIIVLAVDFVSGVVAIIAHIVVGVLAVVAGVMKLQSKW